MPDFSAYRRESTSDPTKPSRDSEDSRKLFSYMFTLGTYVMVMAIFALFVQFFMNIEVFR